MKKRTRINGHTSIVDLTERLTSLLKSSLIKRSGEMAVMSLICLQLSQVCEDLAKLEIKKNDRTQEKKYSKKFLTYSIVFSNMSKLFEKEIN